MGPRSDTFREEFHDVGIARTQTKSYYFWHQSHANIKAVHMSYSISWEPHSTCITYRDRVTFDEFMEAILTIHASEDYKAIRYVIHNMLDARDVDFSGVDMTRIVAHELGARFTNTRVRPAVVSTNPIMGEMIRVFSSMTRLEVGFFPSVDEATKWCDRLDY